MARKNKPLPMNNNNRKFFESLALNDLTFADYKNRLMKIALSMFEWVNLPDTMDARYLELTLYLYGMAALFKDKDYGFINTQCAYDGNINIYRLPTTLNCFAVGLQRRKLLYTGLENPNNNPKLNDLIDNQAILVMNNWNRVPTSATLDLFAYRLYEVERSLDVNVKTSKFPIIIKTTQKQKHSIDQFINKYDGNYHTIITDKNTFDDNNIEVVNTGVKLMTTELSWYKKQIWNEALTFLGINTLADDKKERLITDEANSNNELINLNLQSYLAPRQKACEQFNKFYNPEKPIEVRVRSDLKNIIKQAMSVVSDYQSIQDLDNNLGGGEDVNVYNKAE